MTNIDPSWISYRLQRDKITIDQEYREDILLQDVYYTYRICATTSCASINYIREF